MFNLITLTMIDSIHVILNFTYEKYFRNKHVGYVNTLGYRMHAIYTL